MNILTFGDLLIRTDRRNEKTISMFDVEGMLKQKHDFFHNFPEKDEFVVFTLEEKEEDHLEVVEMWFERKMPQNVVKKPEWFKERYLRKGD